MLDGLNIFCGKFFFFAIISLQIYYRYLIPFAARYLDADPLMFVLAPSYESG